MKLMVSLIGAIVVLTVCTAGHVIAADGSPAGKGISLPSHTPFSAPPGMKQPGSPITTAIRWKMRASRMRQ